MSTSFELIQDNDDYTPQIGDLLTHFADGDIGIVLDHDKESGMFTVQFFGPDDDEIYKYSKEQIKKFMQHVTPSQGRPRLHKKST